MVVVVRYRRSLLLQSSAAAPLPRHHCSSHCQCCSIITDHCSKSTKFHRYNKILLPQGKSTEAMPERSTKGTVTSLSSLYPVEEMEKALKHIQITLNEKQREIENMHHFIDDNTNLINRVQSLPDELRHHIMVPFGKVAFFPGSLIHTNEFLVLLGEGYYAQRTSKQTNEILRRREKALVSQIAVLKADMTDIKSKASFFESTAAQAKEGVVEIREDIEDEPGVNEPKASHCHEPYTLGDSRVHTTEHAVADDEEYARWMSRFDELEKEELSAEINLEQNVETQMEKEFTELEFPNIENENRDCEENRSDDLRIRSSNQQPAQVVKSYDNRDLLNNVKLASSVKDYKPSAMKISNQSVPNSNETTPVQRLQPSHDSLRAFTGSIVERTDNLLLAKGQTSQPSSSQPSRPVSRFRMQRT